jgi:hypothetical protein
MKIRPVSAELFHRTDGRANGQRDVITLIVALRGFGKAPKKGQINNNYITEEVMNKRVPYF